MTAFLFDLNGTLIDDMDCHTRAWLQLLNNQLGGNFSYEQVKREMYGKNSEALQRFFGSRSFTAAEVKEVSEEKGAALPGVLFPAYEAAARTRGVFSEGAQQGYQNGHCLRCYSCQYRFYTGWPGDPGLFRGNRHCRRCGSQQATSRNLFKSSNVAK